jgi:hypothetical protein
MWDLAAIQAIPTYTPVGCRGIFCLFQCWMDRQRRIQVLVWLIGALKKTIIFFADIVIQLHLGCRMPL